MRKYLIYFILSSIFPTFFLSSCGEDRSGEYYALIASKTWMYETMQQNYLFYEDLPAEDGLDFFDKPADFLTSVASDRDQKMAFFSLTSILLKYPVCKAVILHSASKEVWFAV